MIENTPLSVAETTDANGLVVTPGVAIVRAMDTTRLTTDETRRWLSSADSRPLPETTTNEDWQRPYRLIRPPGRQLGRSVLFGILSALQAVCCLTLVAVVGTFPIAVAGIVGAFVFSINAGNHGRRALTEWNETKRLPKR